MRKIAKRVGVIGAVSALAVSGGIAWAAWTASGSGTGSATAGSAQALTATAVVTEDIYPGATVGLTVTVRNPNPYPVLVTGISGSTAPTITVTPVAGKTCAESNVTFTPPATLATPIAVSKRTGQNDGTGTGVVPGALTMIESAPDGCQGATIAVTFPLAGASTTPAPTST